MMMQSMMIVVLATMVCVQKCVSANYAGECAPICQHDNIVEQNCPGRVCASMLPVAMQQVALPLAYIGPIECIQPTHSCKCSFPGITKPPSPSIYSFGDSTVRQLSFGIEHGRQQAPDIIQSRQMIQSIVAEQQTAWCKMKLKNTSTLCSSKTARHMDIHESYSPSEFKHTTIFQDFNKTLQQALHTLKVNQPTEQVSDAVAVFNMGLHLLGGYVTLDRWAEGRDRLGSHFKEEIVQDIAVEYPAHLVRVSRMLKATFGTVIYVNTNAVNTAEYHGMWHANTESCEQHNCPMQFAAAPSTDCVACFALKQSCVARYGENFRDACSRVAFDTAGSATLTSLEETLRPCASTCPAGSAQHFLIMSDNADTAVDAFVNRHLLDKTHPECTGDGRHYYGIELVTARVVSDALLF